VYDVSGRKVYGGKYALLTGFNTIPLPSGNWAAGVYFFNFTTSAGENFLRKAVKQ
jgi:hypothetical protein